VRNSAGPGFAVDAKLDHCRIFLENNTEYVSGRHPGAHSCMGLWRSETVTSSMQMLVDLCRPCCQDHERVSCFTEPTRLLTRAMLVILRYSA
jgi:hypothetical protein